MRVLEKCLPRNDIVRELAPYLQHVHRDDGADDESRHPGRSGDTNTAAARTRTIANTRATGSRTPRECDFVQYEEGQSITSQDSHRHAPLLHSSSVENLDTVDEIAGTRANENQGKTWGKDGLVPMRPGRHLEPTHVPTTQKATTTATTTTSQPKSQATNCGGRNAAAALAGESCGSRESQPPPLQKKSSLPKIKTDLGDIVPVRWEKVVIVQVSVQGFREMMGQAKELMEEAKLLYEHTVLSRLSTEYGGQEILSQSRSGLFLIAFASEFHAAKWCLSLQLSLVYAAWNEKLLKQFADMKEMYARPESRCRRNVLLYRGFRVRMVIHTADSDIPPEKSLPEAVKWTNTVSEFSHGGQIVLSDSVWDRLKEQLVQLGNPVVEDLGCHLVLNDEVMLMLLLPRDLECRRFDKLMSPYQLAPGMRDAPSAHKPLTMVFTFIEGARPLVRCHAEELAERIKTLCMVARELLRKHNGYECQELQGDFMLAFFNPVSAVMWCSEFQLRVREKFREWDRESQDQELRFSMSMGIETGIPASVSPHKTSGRADYFGNIVNQTARIAKAAHGGQVLIGGEAWNAFQADADQCSTVTGTEPVERLTGSTVVMFKFHGYYAFKGISLPIALIEAVPVETPFTRGENIRILLSKTRSPKSTLVEDGQRKAPAIAPVPSEMMQLHHKTDACRNTIRETELGSDLSIEPWDESIPIVEEQGSFDEENETPSPMPSSGGSRLNHSGLMHALRASLSTSSTSASPSPRAVRSERMDRV